VVLHSPVLNVYVDGRLCWGNIPVPKSLITASIPDFERAVFDSWSTHPNPGQEATATGRGGLIRLWDDLAARKASRFPVRRLKPFGTVGRGKADQPVTLGALIKRSVRA
jgi:PRTRC genetic system protein B